MKKPLLAVACVCACLGAGAADYTWKGGASGTWNEETNWSPEGVPTGGDCVHFDADAEITDDFEIGAGMLTLSNATATVHLKGVVSGAGGIFKGGAGALHLHGANTFADVFQSQGTGYTPGGKKLYSDSTGTALGNSGVVYCYDVSALGAKSATFDPYCVNNNGNLDGTGGSLPVFTNCSGTVAIPLTVSRDKNNCGVLVMAGNGPITFAERVSCPFRMRMYYNTPYAVTFAVKTSHNNYANYTFNAAAKVYVPGEAGSINPCGTSSAGEFHLTAPSSSFNLFHGNPRVVCDCANAIAATLSYWEWQSATSTIDLNGYDQTVGNVVTNKYVESCKSSNTYGYTSATPAQIKFVGTRIVSFGFHGTFYGAAGIEWDPQNLATTYTYSNAVSATTGDVSVKSGTFRLAHGATFSSLDSFTVADGARFEIASTGGNMKAAKMTLGATAVLALNGAQLNAGELSIGGETLADGVYSALTHPAVFEGRGSVLVRKAGAEVAWKGAAGGLWSDGANWEGGKVPGAADDAVLGKGARVIVDASPARVHLVSVQDGATLVFSNWTTCVEADYVDVQSGGTITCAGGFTNELYKSRVWLKCGVLTVLNGGKVDASRQGWSGGLWDTAGNGTPLGNDGRGWGPGASGINGLAAASHGGLGGAASVEGTPGALYDDPYAPVEPGSGGTRTMKWGSTESNGAGGGAVRIEATVRVRVDGAITADGTPATTAWKTSYNHDSASSGGSVWITTPFVEGAGLVSANGGDGGAPVRPGPIMLSNGKNPSCDVRIDFAGGGGMVKIETTDAAQQATADVAGLRFAANPGYYPNAAFGADTLATYDRYGTHAEAGTVVVTDAALRMRLLGNGLSGRVLDVASFTHEGDFEWSWGHVSFPVEGFAFRVTGNLRVTSENSRLDLGDVCITNKRCAVRDVWGGSVANVLEVGGDLTVADGAVVAIRAAETNGAARWGAHVLVGGTLAVGKDAVVIAACDPVNFAAPHFAVGSLDVQAGGTLSADRRGAAGGWGSSTQNSWLGNPHPAGFCNAEKQVWNLRSTGGSHGGLGGDSINANGEKEGTYVVGACYDDVYKPALPGAGGNVNGYGDGGPGGGVVYVEAATNVVVDGVVSANGWMSGYFNWSGTKTFVQNVGAGAGGSIYLYGRTVTGSGLLRARGGDSANCYDAASGAGGGGCVAVRTGLVDELVPAGRETRVVRKAAETALPFAGTVDVGGGTNVVAVNVTSTVREAANGSAGTVRWSEVKFAPGTAIFVR